MKFIADVMLGRLAKWMRLLGFDVLYERTLDDNEIIRLSLDQNRVILTRDTGLAGRPLAANLLFIESDHVKEQLQQIQKAFNIESAPGPYTRCSICNEPLAHIAKERAKDLVPEYVYARNSDFLRCSACGRIYWQGSHVQRMALPTRKGK